MIDPPLRIDHVRPFLQRLGYPADLTPIAPESWPPGLAGAQGRWWYAGTFGSLDLHVLETDDPRGEDGLATLRGLSAWNVVKTHVLLRLASGEARLLLGRYGRRTASLRLDRSGSEEEIARRLECARRLPGDRRDPARLFDRVFESESTGRRFFERFRSGVEALSADIRRSTRASAEACADEALLVMSRILFLCFIQRKGWLDGDVNFLGNRIRTAVAAQAPLWSTVLRPLFFSCLNRPLRGRPAEARRFGRIPYLNGGLFEESSFERRFAGMAVENATIVRAFEQVFDLFEFSVREETEEVTSIDPEMLGRVFESLMAAGERSASGSFYTPAPTVDRIVRTSFAEALGKDASERRQIEEALAGDACTIPGDRKPELAAALREMRVLDPACGTGAFLLGALHMIETFHSVLTAEERDPMTRRRIVEEQLYGIDRKREAVRLCELRLWLAIVSAEDGERIDPLPNLDRNIAHGDSLMSPLEFERALELSPCGSPGSDGDPHVLAYRRSSGIERARWKRRLARRDRTRALQLIDAAIVAERSAPVQTDLAGRSPTSSRLREMKKLRRRVQRGDGIFFEWRITFAEVARRGGFDVIVGNPPWVRHSALDPAMRTFLARRYSWFRGDGRGFRQSDLYIAFLQRCFELVREGGVVGCLVPEKLLSAGYAAKTRAGLMTSCSLRVLFREQRDTFDADTFPLAIVAGRRAAADGDLIQVQQTDVVPADLAPFGADGPWLIVPDPVRRALSKLERLHPPLASAYRPRMGVKTGDNRLFLREHVEPSRGGWIVDGIEVPHTAVVRLYRGRDLQSDGWGEGVWMLWPEGLARAERPALQLLARSAGCEPSRLLKLHHALGSDAGEIVAWKDVSTRMTCLVLPRKTRAGRRMVRAVPNQTLYYIRERSTSTAAALEVFLQSTPASAFALAIAEPAKDGRRRYMGNVVGQIPFPSLRGDERWEQLAALAPRLRCREGACIRSADRLVASVLGLSAAELRSLDQWLRGELAG